MEQRPSELPAFTNRVEVEMDFLCATEAGRVISSARMEGEGGILLGLGAGAAADPSIQEASD